MIQDRVDLRRRLVALAAGQSGYFTASQARAAGYSYQAQKYHADRGNWSRVDRGLFRLPEWPTGDRDDLVRWTLWSRGNAVVSHDTALVVHDLGDVNSARAHLTVPPGFRARAAGVEVHRGTLPEGDVRDHGGFRVTTPLRALLDCAAARLDQDQLVGAVRDALDRGLVTRSSLRARADEFGDRAALRIERVLTDLSHDGV